MRAVVYDQFGGPEVMRIADIDVPEPQKGEVQIKSAYASVNPVDWKIREGWLKKRIKTEFPAILGWDVSGTVSAVGEGVENLKVGDEVYAYCRKEVVQWGTYAEYVCVNAAHAALKPKNINFAEASAIPLVSLTAWQALFDMAKLTKEQTILIHAGAGGVGSMAIQLSKWAKASVYATASQPNHEYITALGADLAIDYHKEDLEQVQKKNVPDGFDVVLETVGEEVFDESLPLVKKGGWLVTITKLFIEDSIGQDHGIRTGFVFVRPDGEQLSQITKLIEDEKLKPPHILEFPLDDVEKALEKSREGHTQGKIVLKI